MPDAPGTTAAPPAEAAARAARPRFTARLRYARISARKMRYVVDLIRGKDYNQAIAILRVCPKRGAMFCKKLLESAVANATDLSQARRDFDANNLVLVEARVDPGPIIKRWRPSSVRRPYQIKKRLCHVTLTLQEREPRESKRDRAKRQQQEKKAAAKAAQAPAAPAPGAAPAAPPAPPAPAPEQKKTARKKAAPSAEQKKTGRKEAHPPKTERKEKKDKGEGKEK